MPDNLAGLRKDILGLCFDRYDGTFADGQEANNKLDLELVKQLPSLAALVSYKMATMVVSHNPDLLVSTPKGADWLTRRVAGRLGVAALILNKNETTKEFTYSEDGEETVAQSDRLVIVDDVLNRLTNTGKVYALPGIAEHAVAIAGIWDRNPSRETKVPIPTEAIIVEEIPDMLPASHSLWNHAK